MSYTSKQEQAVIDAQIWRSILNRFSKIDEKAEEIQLTDIVPVGFTDFQASHAKHPQWIWNKV